MKVICVRCPNITLSGNRSFARIEVGKEYEVIDWEIYRNILFYELNGIEDHVYDAHCFAEVNGQDEVEIAQERELDRDMRDLVLTVENEYYGQ